jgi:hypothetical protein
LWKTGGTWSGTNRERLQSIPYLDITLGTTKNATFLLRAASFAFIFHRRSVEYAQKVLPSLRQNRGTPLLTAPFCQLGEQIPDLEQDQPVYAPFHSCTWFVTLVVVAGVLLMVLAS